MSDSANVRDTIDWTAFTWPESTVTCLCGHTYRSHAKFVYGDKPDGIIARKPCGVCGGERMKTARSDPETMTL